MEEYRVKREDVQISASDCIDSESGIARNVFGVAEKITFYSVQVKTFLFWHTVKTFKKIMPAARLLHHLRQLKG